MKKKKYIAEFSVFKTKIFKSASYEGKKMKINQFTNYSWSNVTHLNSHSYAKISITVISFSMHPFSPAVKPPVC